MTRNNPQEYQKTIADFVKWAQAQTGYSATRKYILSTDTHQEQVFNPDGSPKLEARYEGGELEPVYKWVEHWVLEEAGSSSTWHPSGTKVRIPQEVGEALAKVWKTRDTGYRKVFAGMRTAASVLSLIDPALSRDVVAQIRIAKEREEQRGKANARNTHRRAAMNQLDALSQTLDFMERENQSDISGFNNLCDDSGAWMALRSRLTALKAVVEAAQEVVA